MAESCDKIVSNNANLQVENKPVECSESEAEHKTEGVMGPMLLEDYEEDSVPSSLQNLLDYFKRESIVLDKNDTLAVFIYILMLEIGFVPSDYVPPEGLSMSSCDFHYKRVLSLTKSMPNNWRHNNIYAFEFRLNSFMSHNFTLTCVPVAEELVINGSVPNIPTANFSILVDPSMYIISSGFCGSLRIYQNLRDLCQKFKTVVGLSCKASILDSHSIRPASLQRLPPEVCYQIFTYCSYISLTNLNRSCKYFNHLLKNRKHFLKRKSEARPRSKLKYLVRPLNVGRCFLNSFNLANNF